jgi:hypothetical protein
MQRCFAAKSNKENGIVAPQERGFESLRPDHRTLLILKAILTISATHLFFTASSL